MLTGTDTPLSIAPVALPTLVVGNAFEGPVATFTGGVADAQPSDFLASINWGNGPTVVAPVVSAGPGRFEVVGTNTYTQVSPAGHPYSITVTVVDLDSLFAYSATGTAVVADAPIAPTGQSIAAVEGAAFQGVVATFHDGNPLATAADFSASIAWGDGDSSIGTIQALGDGNFSVAGSKTYASYGDYTVDVAITDDFGTTAVASVPATVADAPLSPSGSNPGIVAVQGAGYSGPVVQFGDADAAASASGFSARIDWGDGQVSGGSVEALGGGVFQVVGSNTYGSAGQFPVAVTIADAGGSTLAEETSALIVVPVQGGVGNSGITNNPQPTIPGTAQPGMVVSVFVQPQGDDDPTEVGQAGVNASGQWSLTFNQALADGSYAVTATEADGAGVTVSTSSLGSMVVDTRGPSVVALSFDAQAQQLRITFNDVGSGLDPTSLADAADYGLSLVSGRSSRSFAVTRLQTIPGASGSGDVTEVVSYNLGRRPSAGTYVVTLHADGIKDRAGNPLVATTFVTFPQTTNAPDPDYVAALQVGRNLVASTPQVYIPAAERLAAARYSRLVQSHFRRA